MSIAPHYTNRQLTIEDVTLLKELLRVFGHAFNDSETYQHAIPNEEYLTNLLGKEHFIVVVAMMEKTVVGGLAAYVLEKFEQQRREIYIYDLAVSDAHRRKGVASGTIDTLKPDCRGPRCLCDLRASGLGGWSGHRALSFARHDESRTSFRYRSWHINGEIS
jgi:aminoglycoside 3-N-acetyltransferase I